jgi:farnesyl diphosphate synthase
MDETLTSRLEIWRERVEGELDRWLPSELLAPQSLHAAQRYSVLGPGKRIRPALVYATAETLGVPLDSVDASACAIELIHAYSLVHDDLPAMDNDDLRRGRPTCHKAFGEGLAILAGDSLQVLAFKLLAGRPNMPPDARIRAGLIELLADASGTSGMAGGQALDLEAQGRLLSLSEIEQVHSLKTGALIRASVLMAAHCSQRVDAAGLATLGGFGSAVGLAFQIQDDILDVEGDPTLLGKATGNDELRGMPTYPSIAGLGKARDRVRQLHAGAAEMLAKHGWNDSPLAQLADWMLTRSH